MLATRRAPSWSLALICRTRLRAFAGSLAAAPRLLSVKILQLYSLLEILSKYNYLYNIYNALIKQEWSD